MSQKDHSVVTGRQIAAARTLLGRGQAELAKEASISVPTLKRMEASVGAAAGMANNVRAVTLALEAAGIEFIPENGVRMRSADPVDTRAQVLASAQALADAAEADAASGDWEEPETERVTAAVRR